MENLEETEKQITSAMIQISNIIKSNGMSAICVLYKKQGNVVATPALLAGSSLDIIPAIVQVMQESPQIRNIILAVCNYYQPPKGAKTDTKEMPPYLKDFIEELFKSL